MLLGSNQALTAVWRCIGIAALVASTACSTPQVGTAVAIAEIPAKPYARFVDSADAGYKVWLDSPGMMSEIEGHSGEDDNDAVSTKRKTTADVSPRIIVPSQPLQCVPYARAISNVALYGDAATWWNAARGQYARGNAPRVGAVLVMRATGRNPRGHVAVVAKVLNNREIVVDHANWLNERAIHRNTPVRDVSKKNDWSAVRVWYTPGNQYGARVYPSHGFIYPERPRQFITTVNANIRSAPSQYAKRITTLPRNSEIEVVEEVRDALWYRVAVHGRVMGYIYADLLKPLEEEPRRTVSPSREARASAQPSG